MEQIFNQNGLIFWSEKEIRLRRQFEEFFLLGIKEQLLAMNPSWNFFQVDAPILTPTNLLNPNYTAEDIWLQENNTEDKSQQLSLRPETTPGSYTYAAHLMEHQKAKPPFVVWQAGKSFRREADQVTKNMRLKEFYQQEFQCIFSKDTLNDYQEAILKPVEKLIWEQVGLPCRIVESDRLPTYSLRTVDVEVNNGDKWMELCSISLRRDFPTKARFTIKDKVIEKELLVLEVAIGLDRCVHNWQQRNQQ